MRKTRVIALVIASLVSTASVVQAQAATPDRKEQGARMGRGDGRGLEGRGGRGGLLKGITLSDTEKAKLQAVRTRYAAERKTLRTSLEPGMKDARAARQKGDTAAARRIWEGSKGTRDQLVNLRQREQAELRAALTPANQVKLDANVKQLAERRADGAKGRDGKRGKQGMHRGGRGAGRNG
jgi:Spy/CpxP family protein refolding chaperone